MLVDIAIIITIEPNGSILHCPAIKNSPVRTPGDLFFFNLTGVELSGQALLSLHEITDLVGKNACQDAIQPVKAIPLGNYSYVTRMLMRNFVTA